MAKKTDKQNQINKNRSQREWWALVGQIPDKELASLIHDVVSSITSNQLALRAHYKDLLSLYTNRHITSLYQPTFQGAKQLFDRSISINTSAMIVDTLCAKISKSKVRVYYLPHDGDPDQQERALKLSGYMDHCFQSQNIYATAQEAFRHMCILGSGAFQVVPKDNKITYEPVFIWDLVVDEAEGANPQQLHHTTWLTKSKLKMLYPDFEDQIDKAPEDKDFAIHHNSTADRVLVKESWHLPTIKGAGDGVRVVSIENCILETAEYPYSRFPFVIGHYSKPVIGFWGIGVVEAIKSLQYQLNVSEQQIDDSIKFAIPQTFVPSGTDLQSISLNDKIGNICVYDGPEAPTVRAASTVPPEVFQSKKDNYEKIFEVSGLSSLSVTGKKPPSLESGAAIAEYMDVESERFALQGISWEQLILDASDITLEFSVAMFKKTDKIPLRTSDGALLQHETWENMLLDQDSIEVAKYATPLLPKTPAGETQAIINFTQSGILTPDEAKARLRLPDAEAAQRLMTAPYRNAMKLIQNIIVHGKTYKPTKYMPLEMIIPLGMERLLDIELTDTVDPDRINNLRDFLDLCATELQANQQSQVAAQPPQPANDNNQPTGSLAASAQLPAA